jgi:solute carrier family 12 (potassium/chloride transporter), member 4/6
MKKPDQHKLGTFLGVFTPTILTILGVIMYMRTGWITGQMGLASTLVIVTIANVITLITTLSFSSVATNKKVGVGGAYFIISRSLGFAIGGAVGVPLFLSQVFSITLYSFGLAEIINFLIPQLLVSPIAFITIIAVGTLSFKGADFALKSQIPIMFAVALSLIFLVLGAFNSSEIAQIRFSKPSGEISFFAAFAIFFPAVTGIMAGLGLSGDLKNPQRSIPLGAISATVTGFLIYLSVPVLLSMGAKDEQLISDVMVWSKISPWGSFVIIPGLLGAIFSSAVGSMLGAPRTLSALANDHISNSPIGKLINSEKGNKITFAISLIIALAAVFLGNLNDVATVVTMFFLTVYGVVNLTAAMESISNEPSWRPKFKIPWIISFVGGLACIIVMFMINPYAGFAAIIIEFILYVILKRRSDKSRSGDARRGVYESLIKNSLVKLKDHDITPRNWRPYLQVIVNNPEKQKNFVKFASYFGQHTGIVTVTELIIGVLGEDRIDIDKKTSFMEQFYGERNLVVFPEVNIVEDFENGLLTAIQANGIAGLQSNTIMICWPDDVDTYLPKYLSIMRKISVLKKSFIIGKCPLDLKMNKMIGKRKTIHIWWGGLQRNGDLMLLLAHLMTSSNLWKNSDVKLINIVNDESNIDNAVSTLLELSKESRISAQPLVLVKPDNKSFVDIIHETSKNADAVFLGLNTPEKGDEEAYSNTLKNLASNLNTLFFIKNSSIFQGKLLEMEYLESTNKKREGK